MLRNIFKTIVSLLRPQKKQAESMFQDVPLNKHFTKSTKRISNQLSKSGNVKTGTYKRKISELLLEYAMPLIKKAGNDHEEIRTSISICVVAWNIAVMNKKNGDDSAMKLTIDEMARNFSAREKFKLINDLKKLIKRKEKHFPDDDIVIVNYEVSFSAGGLNVSAAAVLEPREE